MTGSSAPPAPTVSVVLPTYRRSDLLGRAIASVIAQTHRDWELLIVDDNGVGSEHQIRTEAFLRSFAEDPRVGYHPLPRNQGACAARNEGIRLARGEFVAFLDDDDVWHPNKLALQMACFATAGPDVALVYGSHYHVRGGHRTLQRADGSAHAPRNLLKRNGIGTTSLVLCRRGALLEIDGFDERLPSMQDFDLYVRLGQRYDFAWVDEPLLDYHRHEGAAIGKDYQAAVLANRLFYDKHRSLFEVDPAVHHYRLREYGLVLMRADRLAEARRVLWHAWRVRPMELRTALLAATLHRPVLTAFRAALRRLREWGLLADNPLRGH